MPARRWRQRSQPQISVDAAAQVFVAPARSSCVRTAQSANTGTHTFSSTQLIRISLVSAPGKSPAYLSLSPHPCNVEAIFFPSLLPSALRTCQSVCDYNVRSAEARLPDLGQERLRCHPVILLPPARPSQDRYHFSQNVLNQSSFIKDDDSWFCLMKFHLEDQFK